MRIGPRQNATRRRDQARFSSRERRRPRDAATRSASGDAVSVATAWVAVNHRWQLSTGAAEQAALVDPAVLGQIHVTDRFLGQPGAQDFVVGVAGAQANPADSEPGQHDLRQFGSDRQLIH